MDTLLQACIYPFEVFLSWILLASYSMTGNFGASLLLLSLALNIVLLPLYVRTERWQEAERRAQAALQPKLQEIRHAFSGKERFAMIHTLYRQAGYHPIYALRSSLRMLIQVPFLLAAVHLLSDYPPLEGVFFFVFDDLMKPDGLLWGVNLMPLVMTGVSALSVLCYRPRFRNKEMWQFWGVSALFLVWLYSSAVALILFWTFNIVCSLLMNWVYGRLYQGEIDCLLSTSSPSVTSNCENDGTRISGKIGGLVKPTLQSPFLLALLVGIFPVVFYVSNNWFMFSVWDGLSIFVTFSLIVFVVMSTIYVALFGVVQRLGGERASTIIQQLVVLFAIMMLGYLLRHTLLAMGGQDPFVVVGAVGMLSFVLAWFAPRIQIYRVNVALILMCVLHLVNGVYSINSAEANDRGNPAGFDRQLALYDQVRFTQAPNVYYIVPDGYPNQEALEKIFHIDNSEFYHHLQSLGFVIHQSAFSNYRSTTSSLSSTFGMGHHFYKGSVGNFELLDSRQFIVSRTNPVMRIFHNNDYRINFIHADDFLFTSGCDVDVCAPHVFLGEFSNVLIPGNLSGGNWLEDVIADWYGMSITNILKHMEWVSSAQPHFTYVHLGYPGHSPSRSVERPELAEYRQRFPRKMTTANEEMMTLVHSIVSHDPKALIILNADHGAWGLGALSYVRPDVFDGVPDRLIGLDHLGVLLAIRWPEDRGPVGQKIRTNVNLFRYVFSYLSGKDSLSASRADDDGFLTKGDGSEEMLIQSMHNGMVLENMIELGPSAAMKSWSGRGYGKWLEPSWDLRTADANEAEIVVFPDHPHMRRVEITRADTKNIWHIQLNQKPLHVEGHAWYSLRFRARADAVREMGVAVSQAKAPWKDLGPYRPVAVTKEWQEYEWEFLATSDDDNARLHFDLGGWNIPVEIGSVRLLQLSRPTPRWRLNLQGGGEAGLVDLPGNPEGIRVVMTSADVNTPHHIQLVREGITLQAQERYRLRVDLRADIARDISVAIRQGQPAGAERGFNEMVSLTSDWQTVEFEFVAKSTEPHAQLHFDLGGQNIPVEIKGLRFEKHSESLSPQLEVLVPADPPVVEGGRRSRLVNG